MRDKPKRDKPARRYLEKLEQIEVTLPIINDKNFYLSYSKVSTWQNCRRKFYYAWLRRLTSRFYSSPHVVGRFAHAGIRKFYEKKTKDPIGLTMDEFQEEKKWMRDNLMMSPEDEQNLGEDEIIIEGMLAAYRYKYKDLIKSAKSLGNEEELGLEYTTKYGIRITGKADHLLKIDGELFIHEVKTSKYINDDYVKNIQNSFQIATYRTIFNKSKTEKIKGIIYDVVRKPAIRLKKKETQPEFLSRLDSYYKNPDDPTLFYMEIIENPLIPASNVINIYNSVADEITQCEKVEDFYHNYGYCHVFQRCEFYDICHFGENALNMSKLRIDEARK